MAASGFSWSRILVLCSALALHNALRIGPVALVDELRELYGVDYAGVGNVLGAYTFSYGLAQLLSGVLTDRFGSRRLLLLGLGLAAGGSTAFALAGSYPVAVAARLILGVSGGFLYTPTITYTFASFDPALRGRAMGIAQSGVGAGQVLAIVGTPLLFAVLGLTPAFLAFPLVSVALSLLVWRLPEVDAARRSPGEGVSALVRERDFWILLVGFALVGMLAQISVLSWMPTYLRQVHGYGAVAAGLSGSIVVGGLMVFAPVFGTLADRLATRRPVMLLGCGLALAGWLTLLVTRRPWVAIAAAALVSASMAATIPMQVVYASERFARVGAGTAIGLVNTGSQLAASVGTPLYGAMLDRGLGFGAVWGLSVALGVVRIGAVLGLREPERRRPG